MSEFTELDRQIQQRLDDAELNQKRRQEAHNRFLAENLQRARQFGQVADHVVQTIIRPRVKRLSSYFENAEFLSAELDSRYNSVCRFQHTEKFPVSATLNLAVSHDARFEKLLALYDLDIFPIPFRFEKLDELVFPVQAVDEGVLTAWVEKKIIYCVETYLRLRGDSLHEQPLLVSESDLTSPIKWPERKGLLHAGSRPGLAKA